MPRDRTEEDATSVHPCSLARVGLPVDIPAWAHQARRVAVDVAPVAWAHTHEGRSRVQVVPAGDASEALQEASGPHRAQVGVPVMQRRRIAW